MHADTSTKRRVKSKPLAERFWPRVAIGDPWDCWLWTGTYNALGYGVLTHQKTEATSALAHRIAWELTVGPIPAGEVLRHLCHDPLCVNPVHLMPGSQSENMQDRRSNPAPKPIPPRPAKPLPVPQVLRGCPTCHAMFAVPLPRAARGDGLFCRRACVGRPMAERFWRKVQKTEGCWIWVGARHSKGHGVIGKPGHAAGYVQAHRFSWELHRGPIPEGLLVCHNCPGGDNPSCVRPDHLFLGTSADNGQDMTAKDRCTNSKLTAVRVREMRQRHAAGETTKALAAEFGVNSGTAWMAITHRTWKAVR